MKPTIRTLLPADIPQVLRIEKSVHIAPWTEQTFAACMVAGYPGWLIEVENKIAGFVIISFAADECHILNLCVDNAWQRRGFGQKLLEYALQHAAKQGMGIAWLEVRRSNTRAIALYEKMKFNQVGERKGYYPTVAGDEDALVFAIHLKSYLM